MKDKRKSCFVALAATALVLFLILVPSADAADPLTITETQITNSGAAENPAIYGDKIVYQDNRNGNYGDIYVYDITTKKETRITTSGNAFNPDIYDKKIVWDGGGIFLYDLSTNKVTKIVEDGEGNGGGSLWRSNEKPVIYGNNIVWYVHELAEPLDSFYSISLYDLSTKKETTIVDITNAFLSFPDIYDDKIVYDKFGYGYAGIYMNNISTQKETQINSSEGAGAPRVYGNRIVWQDNNNIIMYDLSTNTETQITTSGAANYPAIYGDRIVWSDGRNDVSNIYMYDLSTNTETQITTSGAATNPDIYDGKIVWQDGRNGKSNIYMAPLTVIADFSASPTSGKAPLKVQFTDKSIGTPTKWKWNFGDGTTSTVQNPTHKYSKVGSYTVKLTATNAEGSNTATKTEYIKVVTKPVAAFSAKPTSGKAPLTVAFTDKSTGIPTKWKWNFGDGKTSTVQNPKHQYLQEGKYKVTLTVTNAAGSSTATKTNYITVTTNTRPDI
ncbi:MAG TPA: PKD domain-containing protein [Methanosarcina sp.]|nr:PKD domain-containing protein [Methanosarcina sp.]